MNDRFKVSGKFKTYWTKNRIIKTAKKYSLRSEWVKESPNSYAAAVFRNLHKNINVVGHFQKKWTRKGGWTREKIIAEAKKFKYRTDWKKHKSYQAAQNRGWVNDPEIAGHLSNERLSRRKYSKKLVLKSAQKFKFKSQWKRACDGEYQAAIKYGWFSDATKHMGLMGSRYYRCLYTIKIKDKKKIYVGLTYNLERRIYDHLRSKRFKRYNKKDLIIKQVSKYIHKNQAAKLEDKLIKKYIKEGFSLFNKKEAGGLGGGEKIWTKAKVLKEALKFKKRIDFKKYSKGAYGASINGKYYDEATKHMKVYWKFKWTKKKIFQDALKYKTKTEWARGSRSYDAAQSKGWIQEASKHMLNGKIFWTKKKVLSEAKKYKKRVDFQKNAWGAYQAAHRIGCYREAVKHMKIRKNQFS
jgi:predicted GIY-YIG superfamily endonuclease